MKLCRFCNAHIEPGQRYCSVQCRLQAFGREDNRITKDARDGWEHVEKSVRRPWCDR